MRQLSASGGNLTASAFRAAAGHSGAAGVFRRAAPILLLALTSACSAYLHDPQRATATANLKTKFDTLSVPAFFDAQEKNLSDLAQREDRAVAELLAASRDYRLLNVVAPATGSGERTQGERLIGLVEHDLKTNYGKPRLTADESKRIATQRFLAATAEENIDFLRTGASDFAAMYKEAGGVLKTDCGSVVASVAPGAPPITHGNNAQASSYRALVDACTRLNAAENFLEKCMLGATAGDLRTLCTERDRLDDVAALEAQTAQLKAAQQALREAMKAKVSDERAAVEQAESIIADAQALPEDEQIKSILTQVEKILSDELSSTINQLAVDADSAAGEAAPPIMAALKALGTAYEIRDRSRARASEHASALLIGLAKIRHDLNLIELDIATRKAEREIVDRQLEALGTQLHYLARTQDALCGRRDPCQVTREEAPLAEAVALYLRSMNVGRGPYEVLSFRRAQVQRSAALKRARTTEEDYRRLIQPAIDQIAAYGAGGIKPETIANLFSGLPFLVE